MVYLCYIIVFQRASGVVQVEGKSSLFTTIENQKHKDYRLPIHILSMPSNIAFGLTMVFPRISK